MLRGSAVASRLRTSYTKPLLSFGGLLVAAAGDVELSTDVFASAFLDRLLEKLGALLKRRALCGTLI